MNMPSHPCHISPLNVAQVVFNVPKWGLLVAHASAGMPCVVDVQRKLSEGPLSGLQSFMLLWYARVL